MNCSADEVQIGDSMYRLDADRAPYIPADRHPALVDTGSELSCIDSVLATRLNLPAVGHQSIAGVGGVYRYLAQICIPELEWVIHGQFAGVHLAAAVSLTARCWAALPSAMVYDGVRYDA